MKFVNKVTKWKRRSDSVQTKKIFNLFITVVQRGLRLLILQYV